MSAPCCCCPAINEDRPRLSFSLSLSHRQNFHILVFFLEGEYHDFEFCWTNFIFTCEQRNTQKYRIERKLTAAIVPWRPRLPPKMGGTTITTAMTEVPASHSHLQALRPTRQTRCTWETGPGILQKTLFCYQISWD